MVQAGVLSSEGRLVLRDGNWNHRGDAMDVAFLALGHKLDLNPELVRREKPFLGQIPYESEQKFAAVFYQDKGELRAASKGAVETVLPFCDRMHTCIQAMVKIANYLKTGSAYYAPAAGAVQMVDSIINDRKRILPCACWLEGQYGINNLFVGVLAKLGTEGVEQIIELDLNEEESAALKKSASSVKTLIDILEG